MDTTETSKEVIYCNQCGTANPLRTAVCCNCGHVHAAQLALRTHKDGVVVVERWFWIILRIACGVAICVSTVVPTSGAVVSPELLGSIFGVLAAPVVIAVMVGNGDWAKSSRWFLGAAVAIPVVHYVATVFARVRLR
jgi:hypothetical protein